jgi:hypothetical protein|tara:strand:- start:1066 stop:1419 length:354 start_codon:yes stop_codon:yes gene_type:complete
MTVEFLGLYFWGLIISTNLVITFYVSTFKLKILEWVCALLKKEHNVITAQDFDDYVVEKLGAFGEMLSCPLCFGFWLSLVVSTSMQQYFDLPAYYIVFSIFSWPSISAKMLNWFFRN